jgi:phosphate transport system protein
MEKRGLLADARGLLHGVRDDHHGIVLPQFVDQMYNAIFREFLTFMMEDPRNITPCMHLHFIAKNTERMGDLVTSIAEQVIYLVSGEMPEDPRPKGDTTSVDPSIAPDINV